MTAAHTQASLNPGIEVKGAFVISAIQTLAEFRKLGETALAEQGVTILEPHAFYPVALRRSVHSAIYDRFGTPGIFWVGLETPHHFNTEDERPQSDLHMAILPAAQALAAAGEGPAQWDALADFMHALVKALNVTVHDSVRGHSYRAGWFLKPIGQPKDMTFELTSNTTSWRDHEAFARGIMHWCLRTYAPDLLDFELSYLPESSEDHPGYSCVHYGLRFMPMAVGQTQALRLSDERSQAREALFRRALDHAMSQEARATQALNDLARSHQYTLESIHYAAALQKHQLPKPARWANRVRDLAAWWAPKDVIGGDMWWMDAPDHRSEHIHMALIDCTGHGVPGAMLALLVSNSLERMHLAHSSLQPRQAVEGVQQALHQSFGERDNPLDIDNGCDLLVMQIDPEQQQIHAALAGLGLMLWRAKTQQVEWVVSPRSGVTARPESLDRMAVCSIGYARGDRLVLTTDGLTDQIGQSLPSRAFGYRRMEEALTQAGQLQAEDCVSHLRQAWEAWQGQQLRRDDVTLIVVDL